MRSPPGSNLFQSVKSVVRLPQLALLLVLRSGCVRLRRVKILFIGDIVGSPGRRILRERLPGMREELALDLVIANGENSAGGAGITPEMAAEIYDTGVDIITTGDHLWDQKSVTQLLESESRFVRPLNYPAGTPGQGFAVYTHPNNVKVVVVNLQGRTFMPDLENPFLMMDEILPQLREISPNIIVDMHAEATSEKIAMARFLDGRITALIGTHTHVQTADEHVFPGGTGFLCDAGFTGGQESILGREIKPIVQRFLTLQPQRFGVAKQRIHLKGALLDIDELTGKCRSVTRVSEALDSEHV